MPSSNRWPEAALAGLASSMRTTAAPAVLAARGRISGKARVATLVAAAGELAADKSPVVSARTKPPALGERIAAGADGCETASSSRPAAKARTAGMPRDTERRRTRKTRVRP